MKVVIISDLHANLEAVSGPSARVRPAMVLGDLVNYGPNPAEVVDFVRSRAKHVVRGDHDQFLATTMTHGARGGSGNLPRRRENSHVRDSQDATTLSCANCLFRCNSSLVTHVSGCATRSVRSALWIRPPESEGWKEECVRTPAEILLVGHSHVQFMKKVGDCLLVNPGSSDSPRIETIWRALRSGKTEGSVCVLRSMRPAQRSRKWETCLYGRLSKKMLVELLRTGSLPEQRTGTCIWQPSEIDFCQSGHLGVNGLWGIGQ